MELEGFDCARSPVLRLLLSILMTGFCILLTEFALREVGFVAFGRKRKQE